MRARLEELEAERATLIERLANLQSKASSVGTGDAVSGPINGQSKAAEKIRLFRRLLPVGQMFSHSVGRTANPVNRVTLQRARMNGSVAFAISRK
jgi:hypothetical protein